MQMRTALKTQQVSCLGIKKKLGPESDVCSEKCENVKLAKNVRIFHSILI